ncbi:MAG: apurinic endonuclease [Terrestrivirus sp.]|uniref:Apurinic endonuclease n=1 Tax=Terrestrivirus sp. TaxID=2487775 RepID=A0A3G4ZLL8_9VIRU|nr:MAG: apurinic endonuclease [Terrestrivirus sp.]
MGIHVDSTLIDANDTKENGNIQKCDIVQVFVPSAKTSISGIKNYNGKYVVHGSYTINLARNWDEYSIWIHQFIKEIILAHQLKAIGIVIHMGKQLELTKEEAYNNMYTSLLYVNQQTIKYDSVKIFLETSTGQGSEMCYKLEDFAHFFKKIIRLKNTQISDRFKICLDTCHIFAAGYDLSKESSILLYLEALEELIGLRYVGLIHLNDSKNEVGSNIDRHENIGKGKIGKEGLLYIVHYFKKLNVPIILETPSDNIENDLKLILK